VTYPSASGAGTKALLALLHAGVSLGLFFDSEDGDDIYLRNFGGGLLSDYTLLYPRR
jgi:hypothetical protein